MFSQCQAYSIIIQLYRYIQYSENVFLSIYKEGEYMFFCTVNIIYSFALWHFVTNLVLSESTKKIRKQSESINRSSNLLFHIFLLITFTYQLTHHSVIVTIHLITTNFLHKRRNLFALQIQPVLNRKAKGMYWLLFNIYKH